MKDFRCSVKNNCNKEIAKGLKIDINKCFNYDMRDDILISFHRYNYFDSFGNKLRLYNDVSGLDNDYLYIVCEWSKDWELTYMYKSTLHIGLCLKRKDIKNA